MRFQRHVSQSINNEVLPSDSGSDSTSGVMPFGRTYPWRGARQQSPRLFPFFTVIITELHHMTQFAEHSHVRR